MVSRGMESTVTCCRSALTCAIIWLSELATPSEVLSSVPPAAALAAPALVSEPSSRMFSAVNEPAGGGAAVAVARFESSVTMACTLREMMPESARDLIAHSQPVAVSTMTATRATAIRPAISSPCRPECARCWAGRPAGRCAAVGRRPAHTVRGVARLVAHATSLVSCRCCVIAWLSPGMPRRAGQVVLV